MFSNCGSLVLKGFSVVVSSRPNAHARCSMRFLRARQLPVAREDVAGLPLRAGDAWCAQRSAALDDEVFLVDLAARYVMGFVHIAVHISYGMVCAACEVQLRLRALILVTALRSRILIATSVVMSSGGASRLVILVFVVLLRRPMTHRTQMATARRSRVKILIREIVKAFLRPALAVDIMRRARECEIIMWCKKRWSQRLVLMLLETVLMAYFGTRLLSAGTIY